MSRVASAPRPVLGKMLQRMGCSSKPFSRSQASNMLCLSDSPLIVPLNLWASVGTVKRTFVVANHTERASPNLPNIVAQRFQNS
jgi:hypothetical protein